MPMNLSAEHRAAMSLCKAPSWVRNKPKAGPTIQPAPSRDGSQRLEELRMRANEVVDVIVRRAHEATGDEWRPVVLPNAPLDSPSLSPRLSMAAGSSALPPPKTSTAPPLALSLSRTRIRKKYDANIAFDSAEDATVDRRRHHRRPPSPGSRHLRSRPPHHPRPFPLSLLRPSSRCPAPSSH